MDIWQEIEALKRQVTRLEALLAERIAIVAQHPVVKIGDIIVDNTLNGERVYSIQERSVSSRKTEVCVAVKLFPNDPGPPVSGQPVSFCVDNEGEKYILPNAQRLILVEDLGAGTGKHIEKDESGQITTPPGSETLSIVVAEPNSSFHDSTPSTQIGRVYPAIKLTSPTGDTKYYLVFLEGHGNGTVKHDVDLGNGTSLRITTDYAGKFVSGVLI